MNFQQTQRRSKEILLPPNYVPDWAKEMEERITQLSKEEYLRWLETPEGKMIPRELREIQKKKYDNVRTRCF